MVWTAPALVGLLVGIYLLYLVIGDDYYQHRQSGNEPERIWSRSQVWQKLERVSILAIMTFFGVLAMLTPPATKHPPAPGRVAYALTAVFVAIPAILTAGAVRTLNDRRRILTAIRRNRSQRRRQSDRNGE